MTTPQVYALVLFIVTVAIAASAEVPTPVEIVQSN
jgi:hypothetical protein